MSNLPGTSRLQVHVEDVLCSEVYKIPQAMLSTHNLTSCQSELIVDLFEELVALNAPKRLTESLRAGWLEGRAQMAHWYSMLLANVSTCKKGQERDPPETEQTKRIQWRQQKWYEKGEIASLVMFHQNIFVS